MAVFTGTSGNDDFTAAAGNNTYNALGGNDTIAFGFNLTDATVSYSGNQVIVDAAGFHTILTGFQKYQFNDGLVDESDGNPLVADLFYYSQYHDVWNAHVDADGHYASFGFEEGRDPSAFFDTTFYQALNQPVKLAGTNPLTHFDTTGWLAGSQPSSAFDAQAYLALYPDVAAAHVDPLAHFLQFGGDEGRVPTAISSNVVSAKVGSNGFDPVFYLVNNPDVAAAGADPLTHFQIFGWKEGRNPNAFFDTGGYLDTYADVKASGINPLDHYNTFGWKEGRNPSPWFDTTSYLAANPDVQASGVNPLLHYLLYGIKEGRAAIAEVFDDANGAANEIAVGATVGTQVKLTASWGGWQGAIYSITSDTSNGGFAINAQTGVVTVADSSKVALNGTHTVTVTALDDGHQTSKQFTIVVGTGIANQAPAVGLANQVTSTAENGGDVKVADIVIQDDAQGTSNLTLSGANAVSFAIVNGVSGPELHFLGGANFETKSAYNVTVNVDDPTVGPTPDATANLTLNITNVDEVAPNFTSGTTAAAINENSGAGQVVYTAAADNSGDISGGVSYSLGSAGGDEGAFTINATTGAVTLTGNPNFEAKSSYSFEVKASDAAGHSTSRTVSLAINNRDEVAPGFTSGTTAAAINENSGAGQVVYTAAASDPAADGGPSNPVTYSLGTAGGDEGAFSINAGTGAVTLTGNPNFEAKSSYSFQVRATDAAGNATTQTVSLAINNRDEAAPGFNSGTSANAIDENSGAGQVVYTASATDSAADGGPSNPVTYAFGGGTDDALFSIDGGTGAVTLTGDPNFEAKSSYSFKVKATDAAGNATTQTVSLAINNRDEVAPTITSAASASVNENIGANQVVYTATANDGADISAGVTFSLKAGSDPALSINPTTGAVTLSDNPDFEAKSSYSFTVVASDGVNTPTEKAVTLAIDNRDEVAPGFNSGTSANAIDENSGAGQVVYTAAATDPAADGGPSDPVTYAFDGGTDDALFSIDGGTGAVTLTGDPNFEAKSSYSFKVKATDAAGNATTQTVSLAINNRDEAAPGFNSGTSADAIDENSGAGQVVYTATATDPAADGGPSDPVTYAFGGGTDDALFSIDGGTGAVTLTGDPNFEAKSSYSFKVKATDAAGNATTQTVSLAINNRDEAAPGFNSGTSANAIDENSGAGQVVYTASATDPAADGGPSNPVTYAFGGGTDDALFSIDGGTGAVTLTGDPNFEAKSSYSFKVKATDAAGNATTQTVSLAINNQDEVAPGLNSGTTAAPIDENSGAGQVVYTATAPDPAVDGGPSNPVTFSLGIAGGDEGAFSIDPGTGAVTLTGNPDFEAKSSYSFEVRATDAAGNTSAIVVSLAIDAVSDAPSITSTPISGTATDTSIPIDLTVALTDPSEVLGATVTISGVPSSYALNHGSEITDGEWSVALTDLATLALVPVDGVSGSFGAFDLTVTATSQDGAAAPATATATISAIIDPPDGVSGFALDGYVAGATVFADKLHAGVRNGILDSDEVSTTTAADGSFLLVGADPNDPLVMIGGTDISTGLAFTGTMSAPGGATVITPLTTLVAALVSGGQSLEDAQDAVAAAFGFDSSIDLQTYDPVPAAIGGDPAATAVLSAAIQVQSTVSQMSAVQGASDVVGAIATAITAAAGGAVNLTDPGTVNSIASDAGVPAAAISAVTDVVVAAVGSIQSAIDVTGLAQAATVAQGDATTALAATDFSDPDEVDALTNGFTGTALADKVEDAPVGVISLPIIGTPGSDTLTGTAGSDAIEGRDGNDTLSGLEGDDLLYAGAGKDVVTGGAGDDLIDGGEGTDRAIYETATGSINVQLAAGTVTGDASVGSDTLRGVEGIRGTGQADTFNATGFTALSLNGGGMGIFLAGGNGPQGNFNEFEGMDGDDDITGNGATRISYEHADAAVTVDLSLGTAHGTAPGDAANVGTDHLLGGITGVRGSSYDDTLIGSFNNGLTTETFEGLGGVDTIDGNGGFDRVRYDNQTISGALGIQVNLKDGLVTGRDAAATAVVGTDHLFSIESVRGTSGADIFDATLFAASGNTNNGGDQGNFNEFEGMAGNDQIIGNGNTRVSYGNATAGVTVTMVSVGTGTADGDGSVGHDTFSGVSALRGSAFNDTLTGSDNGNNTTESFEGLGGDDQIFGANGFDRARYDNNSTSNSGIPLTLGISVNMANGTVVGRDAYATSVFGSDTLHRIESVRGTAADDIYVAGNFTATNDPGAPSPSANTGDSGFNATTHQAFNEFEGMGGNDSITGNGNTRASYSAALFSGVTVTLVNGAGTADGNVETIGHDAISAVNAVRGSNFDDTISATTTGSAPFIGYVLEGLSGIDTITGGSGNDRITGGAGNDTIDGGGSGDVDVAVFTGSLSQYTITPGASPGQSTVQDNTANRDGTDGLTNIELMEFSDTLKMNQRVLNVSGAGLTGGRSITGTNLNNSGSGDDLTVGNNAFGRTIDLFGGGTDKLTLTVGGGFYTVANVENLVGSSGNDGVTFQNNVSGVTVNLGGGATDQLNLANGTNSLTLQNTETVFVNGANNTLTLNNTVTNTTVNLGTGTTTLNLAAGSNGLVNAFGVTTINGTGSNDTLNIALGLFNTTVDLGGGTDNLGISGQSATFGLAGVEVVHGSTFDNNFTLTTNVADVTIDLDAGADMLNLANGANSLQAVNIEQINGSDFVIGGPSSDDTLTLQNNVTGLSISLGNGSNTVNLASGANTLGNVFGVATINGTVGDDTLTATNGLFNTTVNLGGGTGDVLNIGSQSATFGLIGVETVNGNALDNFFNLTNTVSGVTIDLGVGNDNLTLASGSSSLTALNIEQINGNDFIIGSSSDDTLTLLNQATGLTVNLANGTNTLNLTATTNTFGSIANVATVNGTVGDDTLTTGNLFNTTINLGGGTNDVLNVASLFATFGIVGVETVNGDAQNNSFNLTTTVSGITVDLGGGTNDLLGLADGVNSLTALNIEQIGSAVAGSSDDTLTLLNNVTGLSVNLGGGTDTLNLASGANTLGTLVNVAQVDGSASADTLTVTNALFGATIDLGDDADTLNLSNNFNTVTVKNIESVNGGTSGDNITIANTTGTTTVTGGGSGDNITASAANDRFHFTAASDSTNFASDTVVNFNALQDLFVFDAAMFPTINTGHLDYIGGGSFGGNAGEVRLETFGLQPMLQIDVDGDTNFDMLINLPNLSGSLSSSHFLLL